MAGAYEVLDWDDKDPAEAIEEAIEFGPALDAGDSLLSIAYSFINQAGLTKQNERIDGTLARLRLINGTAGQIGRLLCTANTAAGEILKQVVRIKVKTKI